MKSLRENKNLIFILILNLVILGSLNINPNSFFYEEISIQNLILNLNLINLFNIIRFFLPSLLCLMFFFYNYYKGNLNLSSKVNTLIILLLIFFTTLYLRTYDIFYPETLYFIIYLNIIIYGMILNSLRKELILKYFFITLMFYFFIISILFFFSLLSGNTSIISILDLRAINILQFDFNLLNNSTPRTTGFARILVFLFLILYYFDAKKNSLNLKILMCIICFLILSLSSRFSVGSLIISLILFNLFFHGINFKMLFKDSIYYLLIPFFVLIFFQTSVEYYFNKKKIIFSNNNEIQEKKINKNINIDENEKINKNINIDGNEKIKKSEILKIESNNIKKILNKKFLDNRIIKIKNPNSNKTDKINRTLSDDITTGRISYWNFVIDDFKKSTKKFKYGHGILADKKKWNISISNSFFYSLYSNGLVGALIYIFILLYFLSKFLRFLFFQENKSKLDFLVYICLLILFLRGLVENSFLSQSMDLLILIYLNQILQNKSKAF